MSAKVEVPLNYEDNADVDLYLKYKKLRNPVNAYTLYNNQDRFLNLAYRYQTSDGFRLNWNSTHPNGAGFAAGILGAEATFDYRTMTMSQYYWSQMGWLGLGYSLVTNLGTISGSTNLNNDKDRRPLSDAELGIGILRSAINMVDESALYLANYYRYKYEKLSWKEGKKPAYVSQFTTRENYLKFYSDEVNQEKIIRNRIGKYGSGVFVFNALIGIAMAAVKLRYIDNEDRNHKNDDQKDALDAQKDSAVISLMSLVVNGLANSYKAGTSYLNEMSLRRSIAIATTIEDQAFNAAIIADFNNPAYFGPNMFAPMRPVVTQEAISLEQRRIENIKLQAKATAWTGSALGLINGTLNILSLLPIYLNDPNLKQRDKNVLALEMANQGFTALLHAGSNFLLARRLSGPLTESAGLALPAFGVFVSGVMGSLSVMEIEGLIRQSGYSKSLEKLGETTSQYGYFGDTMLGDLYDEKVTTERNILIGTTVLTAVSTAAELMCMYFGYAGPAPVIISGTVALVTLIVKGIQGSL